MFRNFLLFSLWVVPGLVCAAPVPDDIAAAIREAVEVQRPADGPPFEIDFLSWQGKAQPCAGRLEAGTPQRLRGKVSFRVRCTSPVWSVSVQAKIMLPGEYWVAERFLPAGTLLAAGDLKQVSGDLAALPEDVVRSDSAALGKVLTRTTSVGAALVLNALRENTVIKAGERIRVNLLGSGFSVTGEGTALSAGAAGESIKLKTRDGQQLVGRVVKAGVVEVILE